MATKRVVFLFDVDNTRFDNDRVNLGDTSTRPSAGNGRRSISEFLRKYAPSSVTLISWVPFSGTALKIRTTRI